MTLRIACIGRHGQTAQALAAQVAGDASLEMIRGGRETLDLSDAAGLVRFIDAARPDAVINAAAYNAVDRAESEPDIAMAVNADGPAALARHCRKLGVPFIHMSTDLVFDGAKSSAYVETDTPNPLSAYGRSKLAGERAVLAEDGEALVTRVCWVFSGMSENFVSRVIALARTRPRLTMVSDQVGAPTHAADIAAALIAATRRRMGDPGALSGLLHLSAAELTSRFDMARAILAASAARGGPTAGIEPIATADYPTQARRPLNAHLSADRANAALQLSWRPWRPAVEAAVAEVLGRG